MRGLFLGLSVFIISTVSLYGGDGALPRTASVVFRFRDIAALRASLLQLLALQSGNGAAEGTLGRWGSVIRQKSGYALLSPKGWRMLGLDPKRPFGVALLGRRSEYFLLSAVIGKDGIRKRRLVSLMRSLSGYSGKIVTSAYYRMRITRFASTARGFALRYGIIGKRILITNHHEGIRAGYGAVLFPRGGFFSIYRSPFRGAPFLYSMTPVGLNGLFRYQLPYKDFFQNHPLSGFFRRVDGAFYPRNNRIVLRLDTAGARDAYLLRGRQLLYSGIWRETKAYLPLDISLTFLRNAAFSMLLSRLPDRMKTAFYIWVIRMRRRYGFYVIRDIIGGWNGKFRFILTGTKDRPVPLIGLGLYNRAVYTRLLRFLRKAGISGEIRKSRSIHICRLRRSFVFFKDIVYLRYDRGMLWISGSKRALSLPVVLQKGRRRRFSIRLSIVPDRLAPLISGKKDKRSDLASFIKTLTAGNRFRFLISLGRRYLNMEIFRESGTKGR